MRRSTFDHIIRRGGQTFQNLTTGATVIGSTHSSEPAMFVHDSELAVGDLLKDPNDWTYIVGTIKAEPGYLAVNLIRYRLTCSIWRIISDPVDDFGRAASPDYQLHSEGNAIIFAPGAKRAQMPISAEVRVNDIVEVPDIQERFKVQSVSRVNAGGLIDVSLLKMDPNSLLNGI